MGNFEDRLSRIKSPESRAAVDLERATPQELKWNQLRGAARTDTKLKELLGAFTGACASARLHSKDPKADMLAVRDRLGDINEYLRHVAKRGELCIDDIDDLPPIQWDGYQR